MSSLEACIRKAGKAFSKKDAAAIRDIRDDLVKANRLPENADPNVVAVDEYIDILRIEKENIMSQVVALGGALADPRLSPSEFAKKAEANLEEAARKFPRKGIERPPTELGLIGEETEVAESRTYKSVLHLYPNFYDLPVKNVLAIVNKFDPASALALAKHFDILPSTARKLIPANYDQAAIKRLEKTLAKPGAKENNDSDWFHGWAIESIVEWIEDNETLPLYFKVEDPAARDLVDANPDHPISMLTKLGALVGPQADEELQEKSREKAKTPASALRRAARWLVDTGNASIEVVLGAVPQTKLKDFVKYGLESVGEYTKLIKEMDAWMNREMEVYHDLAKKWRGLITGKKTKKGAKMLGELMSASTLAGVDVTNFEMPDKAAFKKMNKQKRALWLQRKQDYEILKPFWDKLANVGEQVEYQKKVYKDVVNAKGIKNGKRIAVGDKVMVSEAQAIYMEVRDNYAYMRDQLISNLEDRIHQTEMNEASRMQLIAELRRRFESGKIMPYFPLSRFGKHGAVAYLKNEAGEWESIGVVHKETRRARNEWVEEMTAKGLRVERFEQGVSDLDTLNQIDPAFVARVTDLLEEKTVTEINPKTGEEITKPGTLIQDEIWQMYLASLPEMSARKAYMHREGRLGFSHDVLRAFADKSFHGTHQVAKLRFGFALGELMRGVQQGANILLKRVDQIRNMMDLDWRPEGMEQSTIHEVLIDHPVGGGGQYRGLYMKFQKEAGLEPNYRNFHEPSYIKARDQLIKEATYDGPWAVPLANEITKRHAYNMNPKSGALATKMTGLGFFWFLSTSPAAGLLNLTQTWILGYPALSSRFKGMGAGRELLKASKEYASAPWLGMNQNNISRLTAKLKNDTVNGRELDNIGERAALEYFDEIGIFAKTRGRDLQGLTEGGGTVYSIRQEQALEITGYIFHKTEEMNRAVTALAAYRLGRKKFASDETMTLEEQHEKALEWADELVELSHFDYTNTNRPRWMQSDVGRVVFLFRNYSLNMQYRLIRDFRDGVWKNENIPLSARKEARSRFLGMIGMTSLFAGIGGWPLFWVVEAIANNLVGDDDDELYFDFGGDPNNPFDSKTYLRKVLYDATEKYIAEGWGETVAGAVMKGPWSQFTSMDLSMRASLNNLWIREIPENIKDDPVGLLSHLSGEALGPIWGMGQNWARGVNDLMQGETRRGVEKLVPKFMADYMKAIRYAQQGAQTYQDDMIMTPEEFSSIDLFVQSQGFSPTPLSSQYEQNRAVTDMDTKLDARKTRLMSRLFQAWRLEDRKTARETLKEITEWNKKNPLEPINATSIRQSARMRAAYDMRTVGGIAVDKRRHYLHEQLRFLDKPQK